MPDHANIIYLDVDEEITAAIDRMLKVPDAEVKIVVPKRSTLLQSIVNLKLLKRAADGAKKKLVLVTADQTSMHLAGRVGLAVAATLNATAGVPKVAQSEPQAAEVIEAEEEPDEASQEPGDKSHDSELTSHDSPPKAASNKPAYAKPMMAHTPVGGDDEKGSVDMGKAMTKLRIPNFDALQKRMLIATGIVGVIILFFVLNYFIKRATVTLYAQGSQVTANFPFTADPTTKTSVPATAVLAATTEQSSHDLSTTAPATGTKDVGTKASGNVTIQNCEDTDAHGFPAGSTVTAGDKSFITGSAVTIPGGSFSGGGKNCNSAVVSVGVTASQNGDSYNLGAGTAYTSPSLTANFKIAGGQMSGGTSKTVNVVTQADVDKAKQTLLDGDKDAAKKDLDNKVPSGQQAIEESFTQTAGNVVASPDVNGEGSQTTVKVTVQYTLLTAAKTDFEAMLKAQEQKQVNATNQIYDDGFGNMQLTATKVTPNAASTFGLQTDFSAGQKIDTASVAKLVAGKKYGDAADIAGRQPGVTKVDISVWPFWVTHLSRITSHIKVQIKVVGS